MNRPKILLGMLVSILFIYLIIWKPQLAAILHGQTSLGQGLFGQSRIDFGRFIVIMQEVTIWPLIVCFFLTPLHVFIRAHRWKLMVEPVGKLTLYESFSLQMVGYLANSVLPLRMGEVVRGVLLSDRLGCSKTSALGTVLVERVVDVLTMLIVTLVVATLFPFPKSVADGAIVFAIISSLGLVAVIYLGFARDPFGGMVGKMIGAGTLGKKIREYGNKLVSGLAMLRATHHYTVISIESALLWVVYALQGFLILYSFHFMRDYPMIGSAPILATMVVLVLNAVGVSLPSAPGGVGAFHAVAIFGLSLFDVPTEPAAGFALVIHALTMVYYLTAGLPFMWHEGLRFGELKRIAPEASPLSTKAHESKRD